MTPLDPESETLTFSCVRQEPGRACAEPASRPSAPRSGGGAERRALTAASTRARCGSDDDHQSSILPTDSAEDPDVMRRSSAMGLGDSRRSPSSVWRGSRRAAAVGRSGWTGQCRRVDCASTAVAVSSKLAYVDLRTMQSWLGGARGRGRSRGAVLRIVRGLPGSRGADRWR